MRQKKIIAAILCFSIVFSIVFIKDTPKAKAWPVSISIANIIPEALTTGGTWADFVATAAKWVKDIVGNIAVVALKVAALKAVQSITNALIGDSGGSAGTAGVVSNWNNYLYTSPAQTATSKMNSFFNTVSHGRLSSLNYEGVGPNYDAYLVAQARQSIAGQNFSTNIQDIVTNPKEPFSGGNMKGLMYYMQCANNVACFTLTSVAQYNDEFTKAQTIAKNEQTNGFLPTKKNGVITQPASVVQNAFSAVDSLGTSMITNASYGNDGLTGATAQIAGGVVISSIARTLNYSSASTQGKAEIAAANSKTPTFSISYSKSK